MQISRPNYISQLQQNIDNNKKVILLHGGRGSGKTTILKHLMSHIEFCQKKYYFSFDEDIVAKKFKNAEDFKGYMQIKYGINFYEHNLLLLNEIQYSKNILSLFEELIQDKEMKTTIIATGIIHPQQEDYQKLIKSGQATTITIHPLGFFEFLDNKNIHTTYLSIDRPSMVMFKEIQSLFDEYLIRGGYPEVIKATTRERKQYNLKSVVQKVYDKDVGFYFNGDEILVFQDLMERLCRQTMGGCKYKSLSEDIEISIILIKRYIQFLQDNCLIQTLPYFFTDKKRELSHQETICVGDMGIMSYMTQNYGSKIHNITIIKNFIGNEICKYITETDICMTYKKINNSIVDFVIFHADNTITPIIVTESNTNKAPKVLKGFDTQYGHRIRRYIKTTPLYAERTTYHDKELLCIPHFMIKTVL